MRCRPIVLFLALGLSASAVPAQVFQVQGGGSSLFAGYGGLVNLWGNGYEASLGVGYLDGLRIGASGRRLLGGRDTLRVGNDLLPLTFDTDVFATGATIFAQGASIQRRRGRTQTWIFGGASATALAAPYFGSQRAMHAMAYARAKHDYSRTLSLSAHAITTDRQTMMASATWKPAQGVATSTTLGVGANSPYGALALEANRPHFDVKASLVGMGRHFRRTSAPMPLQTELERDNLLVNWKPADGWSLGVGRQHFRQDSAFAGLPQRAGLTQITGTGRAAGASFSGGWLFSEAGRRPNISSYLTARRELSSWLQSELYLLKVWQPTQARSTTPVLLLREAISPRLSLLQVISRDQGRTSVNFGGTINAGLSSLSVEYQVAHSPYLVADPFVQTMGVNARLHVRGVSLSIGSFVTPDGRVHYSAQGNTFMYRGLSAGRSSGEGGNVKGYVASGRVIDESGAPVDGAALEIGGEVIYTDSQGRFFVRRPSTKPLTLRVVLDDFLVPGAFEVVEAPATLVPSKDDKVTPVRIVVRRVNQTSGT